MNFFCRRVLPGAADHPTSLGPLSGIGSSPRFWQRCFSCSGFCGPLWRRWLYGKLSTEHGASTPSAAALLRHGTQDGCCGVCCVFWGCPNPDSGASLSLSISLSISVSISRTSHDGFRVLSRWCRAGLRYWASGNRRRDCGACRKTGCSCSKRGRQIGVPRGLDFAASQFVLRALFQTAPPF